MRTKENKNCNSVGFSLIEIIISIAILFIGIISMFSLFPSSYRMSDLSKISTRMTMLGQSKMEEVLALGFNNLPSGTHTFTTQDISHIVTNQALQNRFTGSSVTITDIGFNPINGNAVLKQIDVTIVYSLRAGKQKQEIFTTYISNPLHG